MKKYLLKDYISFLQEENVLGDVRLSDTCMNTVVELVSCDSQQVVRNTLFLCKGVWGLSQSGIREKSTGCG